MKKFTTKYYILKFSELKYLEEIKKGNIYFKEAKYFRSIEENHIGDSREGKVRTDASTVPNNNDNLLFQFMSKVEELNLYGKKTDKMPIFCCSIINKENTEIIDETHLNFKKEFIDEMKKWGNSFILINLKEFIEKLNKVCLEKGINLYHNTVKYDQGERVLSIEQTLYELYLQPWVPLFHKTKNYKYQNELRIVIYSNNQNLIPENNDSITLNIGELEDAIIYKFDDLSNIGIELVKVE